MSDLNRTSYDYVAQFPLALGEWTWHEYITENNTEVRFFSVGCAIDGHHDCQAVCRDTQLIWQPRNSNYANYDVPFNVQNCLSNIVNGDLLDKGFELSATINSTEYYNIPGLNSSDTEQLNSTLSQCLVDFCKLNGCDNQPLWTPTTFADVEYWLPDYYLVCQNQTMQDSADVAGIGVYIAYLMAGGILLSLYIGVRLFCTWLHASHYICNMIGSFFSRKDSTLRRTQSKSFEQRMKSARQLAILVNTLADFQKSQCLFWIAINFATVFATLTPSRTLGATSFGVFQTNILFMHTIIKSGFFFTFFGLYTLHAVSQRSWYIFLLSSLSIGTAAIAYYAVEHPDLTQITTNAQALTSCGNVNPTIYCSARVYREAGGFPTSAIMVPVFLMTLVLFVQMLFYNATCFRRRQTRSKTDSNRPTFAFMKKTRPRRLIAASILFVWEGYCVMIWLIMFLSLVNEFLFHKQYPDTGNMEWGFGQILALTVWFPVLLEYLYALFRGLENATDYRFRHPYRLQKIDDAPGIQRSLSTHTSSTKRPVLSTVQQNDDAERAIISDSMMTPLVPISATHSTNSVSPELSYTPHSRWRMGRASANATDDYNINEPWSQVWLSSSVEQLSTTSTAATGTSGRGAGGGQHQHRYTHLRQTSYGD